MVKKMKSIILILLYLLVLNNYSQAKSGRPKEFAYARLMTSMLSNNILLGGKKIPEGWSDLMQIHYMKKEVSPSASEFKAFNSFALVPSSPVINKHKEIPAEYIGMRLFLISRYKIHTNSLAPGRCVILIYPPTQKSDEVTSNAYFIPETTAQLILAQIPDFDPTAQPLAFDDDFLVANQKKFQGEDLGSTIREIEKARVGKNPGEIANTEISHEVSRDLIQKKLQKKEAEWQGNIFLRNLTPWSVTGFLTIGCVIFWYFRHRKALKSASPSGTG
jgi:hypothetical protein